jgi:hypothetical protein
MAYSIYIIIEIRYCIMRGLNKSWKEIINNTVEWLAFCITNK